MSRIKWSREAQADIASIDAHYHALNPGYARRVALQVVEAAKFLTRHPEAGQLVSKRQTRKWRVAGTPYLFFYRQDDAALRILRVVHGARDRERML